MASRNREVAYEGKALAEFIGPVLAQVVNAAPTLSNPFNIPIQQMDAQVFLWICTMTLPHQIT